MSFDNRQTDPTQLPVQVNIKLPFWLREVLISAAADRRVSQAELCRRALERELDSEIRQALKQDTTQR